MKCGNCNYNNMAGRSRCWKCGALLAFPHNSAHSSIHSDTMDDLLLAMVAMDAIDAMDDNVTEEQDFDGFGGAEDGFGGAGASGEWDSDSDDCDSSSSDNYSYDSGCDSYDSGYDSGCDYGGGCD